MGLFFFTMTVIILGKSRVLRYSSDDSIHLWQKVVISTNLRYLWPSAAALLPHHVRHVGTEAEVNTRSILCEDGCLNTSKDQNLLNVLLAKIAEFVMLAILWKHWTLLCCLLGPLGETFFMGWCSDFLKNIFYRRTEKKKKKKKKFSKFSRSRINQMRSHRRREE